MAFLKSNGSSVDKIVFSGIEGGRFSGIEDGRLSGKLNFQGAVPVRFGKLKQTLRE